MKDFKMSDEWLSEEVKDEIINELREKLALLSEQIQKLNKGENYY